MSKDKDKTPRKLEPPQPDQADKPPQEPMQPEPEPPKKPRLTTDAVARLAHHLCAAYEEACGSTAAMQPVARAIGQTAEEVIKLGHQGDTLYWRELIDRLRAICELSVHRHQKQDATLRYLSQAREVLS